MTTFDEDSEMTGPRKDPNMSAYTNHLNRLNTVAAEARMLLLRWQLVQARLRNQLTVEDVAERTGYNPEEVVREMELPKSDPHLSTVRRYAHAVGVNVFHEIWASDGSTEEEQ